MSGPAIASADRFKAGATDRAAQDRHPTDIVELTLETAALRAALGSADPAAILGALEAVLRTACLEHVHPARLANAGGASVAFAFVSAMVDTLDALPAMGDDAERQQSLVEAIRQRAGRGALMLSGGGALSNHHVGVVRALLGRRWLPGIISGASGGALIAAIAGSRGEAELAAMIDGDAAALASDAAGQRPDDDSLRRTIDRLVPDVTFAEAFQRSGRTIDIVVAAPRAARGGLVLNRLTTPDVLLRGAVHASCAVPFLFQPVCLQTRDSAGRIAPFAQGEAWMDGSIFADLPGAALQELHGVDRTIASMVNPVVLPFISHPQPVAAGIGLLKNIAGQAALLTIPLVQWWPDAALALETWQRVIGQTYDADVTIIPTGRFHDPRSIIAFVDQETLRTYVADGERAASAQFDEVFSAIGIEQALLRFG